MKFYDVVIIGAGLAGLQCARLLSQQGAKILLVDRKTDLAKGIHTTGIFVRKTLEDFDFPPGTLGKAVRNITLYSPKLKSINLTSDKDEFRVGKMGKLYQSFLQNCLENGVEFSGGTRYVSANLDKFQTGEATGAQASPLAVSARARKSVLPALNWNVIKTFFRVEATLIASGTLALQSNSRQQNETIVKLEKNGEAFEVRTKVLVGADGANSRVARDLKLDENQEWIVGYEEVFHSGNSSDEPRLHCFLDAELAPGYLAWVADDGEEIHIGVGGYAAGFNPREALKSFKEKVAAKIIDLGKSEPIETRGGRIPVGGVLRRIANENGLLIGDAAGAVSPLTAGGLDPCLRLSAMAANVILERLQTKNPAVLLNYSGELFRARFVSRLWMRRIIAAVSNQKLLEFGFAFLRGRIGRRFAKHVFFGRGSFPDVKLKNQGEKDFLKTSVLKSN